MNIPRNNSTNRQFAFNKSTPEYLFNQALALHRAGQLQEAIKLYEQTLKIRPDFFDALHMLGVASYQSNHPARAIGLISKAIELRPGIPQAYNNLGNALVVAGRMREAVAEYEKAVSLKADYAEAYYNAGCALVQLEELALAITCYDKAIEIEPRYIQAYTNRGLALERLFALDTAVENYQSALRIDPNNSELRYRLGHIYFQRHDLPSALDEYLKVQAAKHDMPYIRGHLLHTRMQMCDWTDWSNSVQTVLASIQAGNRQATHPFHAVSYVDDPLLQRKIAEDWVQKNHFQTRPRSPVLRPATRIRVGFFSADFRMHPVSQLLMDFLENHDRDRFEFIAFSFLDTEDMIQERLRHVFSRFIDVQSMSDVSVANMAREMDIHIAVDLGGYTEGGRMDIFAQRAAPVQVSFLGYPATTGAAYMDYLIADSYVIQPQDEIYYTEKIVRLPHSLLPRDTRVKPSGRQLTRTQFNLPETGMVYCCFNNHAKLSPNVFALWMQILQQVPDSVLWMASPPETVRTHLLAAAKEANIDPARLVFAPRMERLEDHLQRLTLADLFLDTWPYNAHTTASDALFVGLPVLTCAGRTFAGRVAGSLLATLGVPELITCSAEDYVREAVRLGTDQAAKLAIRARVEKQLLVSPLFDSKAYNQALSDLLALLATETQTA